MAAINSIEKLAPLIVAALAKAGDFEAGKTITLQVPADSITLDLSAEGLGKVTVGESGAVLTLSKAV